MTDIDDTTETPAVQFSTQEQNTLNAFFHVDAYNRVNIDVAGAGADPLEHFINDGYREGRALSPAVNRGMLDFLVSMSATHFKSVPDTLPDLLAVLRDWPVDAIYGPTPMVCPSWLSKHPECAGCDTLADILQTIIPVGEFVLHPALSAYYVSSSTTILDIIEQIQSNGEIAELSMVDLDEYIANHRDLAPLMESGDLAFAHLWTSGPLENRLKYLGNRRSRRNSPQENFVAQLKTIYRLQLSRGTATASSSATEITPFELKSVNNNADADDGLRFMMDQLTTPVSLDTAMKLFTTLRQMMGHVATFVLDDQRNPDIEYRSVGSQVLSDQDLMSGAHKVTTKRVVYGVNIGAYDDLPVPPALPDCSYFLITDAAEVPADTPWTIVRPTIQEVDIKRQCLWYKTHPHWLFPEAEFVTWIDSNIQCRSHSETVLMSHEAMSEIATFTHPDRDCVFVEAEKIAELKLDKSDVVDRVRAQMRDVGFPENAGFYETNVLFSRVQDLAVQAFFNTWWRNIYLGSRRDQMSFTYSAWTEGVEISRLDSRFSAKDSRFFSKTNHKSKKGRFV